MTRLIWLGIVALLLACCRPAAGQAAAADAWSGFSPGTLEVAPLGTDEAHTPGVRVSFRPTEANREDYWCGARVPLNAPPTANVVTFFLRSNDARPVHVKLVGSTGGDGYYDVPPAPGDWIKVTIRREFPQHTGGPGAPVPADLGTLEIVFNNLGYRAGNVVNVDIADVCTGTVDPLPLLHPNWMPARTPPPVPGYRIETCIHNIWPGGNAEFGGLDHETSFALATNVFDELKREYGNVGITIAYLNGPRGRAFADYLRGAGGLPLAEGHNQISVEWLREHDAFAININGQKIPDLAGADTTHSADLTHPDVLKAGQDRLLASAKAGATVWRTVDYVWQWPGGPVWGYSDAVRRRWREDLLETDGGLELGKGIEPGKPRDRRFATFWEYFESYHGTRFTPADVGLKSWNDFDPPAANGADNAMEANRRTLFIRLFHYEWLKYINEVARPSLAHGLMAQPICNREHVANGTDLYWLVRLANVRGFATEWWGSAGTIVPTYYNGRYYDNAARTNGKEIILLGESAAAGGDPFARRPNYWDNQANYLITYAQAASIDAKAKHDQYWGSSWQRMSDPKNPEYQSFTAFRSAWCGFLQARNDKALKPKCDVLAITDRFSPPLDFGSNQPFNVAADLVALNYTHDGGAFPLDDSFDIAAYRTIVLSSLAPPEGFVDRVAAWVREDAGRTLVTHGFVPGRSATAAMSVSKPNTFEMNRFTQADALGLGGLAVGNDARGQLNAPDARMAALLGDLIGREVRLTGTLYHCVGGDTLVAIGDQPLVSVRRVGKGRVVYLHWAPNERGEQGTAVQRKIVDAVMRLLDYHPAALTPDNWHALAFDTPNGGRAFVIYNAAARTDASLDGRVYRVFQAQDPASKATVKLFVGATAPHWTATDLITGEHVRLAPDADGYVTLVCDGWNLKGVRLDPAAY